MISPPKKSEPAAAAARAAAWLRSSSVRFGSEKVPTHSSPPPSGERGGGEISDVQSRSCEGPCKTGGKHTVDLYYSCASENRQSMLNYSSDK